jgi:hypothetical protein
MTCGKPMYGNRSSAYYKARLATAFYGYFPIHTFYAESCLFVPVDNFQVQFLEFKWITRTGGRLFDNIFFSGEMH